MITHLRQSFRITYDKMINLVILLTIAAFVTLVALALAAIVNSPAESWFKDLLLAGEALGVTVVLAVVTGLMQRFK